MINENKKKELRLVPLTHVWKLDNKRWKDYKKKHIIIEKFDNEELIKERAELLAREKELDELIQSKLKELGGNAYVKK